MGCYLPSEKTKQNKTYHTVCYNPPYTPCAVSDLIKILVRPSDCLSADTVETPLFKSDLKLEDNIEVKRTI